VKQPESKPNITGLVAQYVYITYLLLSDGLMSNRKWFIVACIASLVIVAAFVVVSAPASAWTPEPFNTAVSPGILRRVSNPSTGIRSFSTVITNTSAVELALAMGIQDADIITATLNGSDSLGVGISNQPVGTYFPTEGETFAILSTGLAESADLPNNEEDLSFELYGLYNTQGYDLVQLWLQLRVPNDRNCANLDFVFYSEEYPEWVGSEYNDTFTAELGGTNIIISGSQVTAPLNFAFDTSGKIMSVNTVFGLGSDTGTTYDGGTSLLRAQTPVVPGSVVDVVLSVQDLGDTIYDTAVFLDKFFWSDDGNCGAGAQVDTDGDGLLDIWETDGVTVRTDGIDTFVDLPAMGADPLHKDIFVEVDYMVGETSCIPFVDYCFSGHTHEPKFEAMQKVIYSFFLAPVPNPDGIDGINLHIDYGPQGIMNPVTLEHWGDLSESNALPHDEVIGSAGITGYNWHDFKEIKKANFSKARAAFFHYAVFAHILGGPSPGTSGLSRGIGASDFLVTLGDWDASTGTVNQQAGTFMHELGHNVGLRHSGRKDLLDTNFKPNFLSVMNYAFQTRGLRVGGKDFFFWCAMNNENVVDKVDAIDWNCDAFSTDVDVKENINEGPIWRHDTRFSKLRSFNDWGNLVFTGGAIGQPGAEPVLPDETENNEITFEQDATLSTDFAVSVGSLADLSLVSTNTAVYTFTITNLGINTDTYTLTLNSVQGWSDLSTIPVTLTLSGGTYTILPIHIDLPGSNNPGIIETISLTAVSQSNHRLEDQHRIDIYTPAYIFLPLITKNTATTY